jgi:hypothetical protein
MCERAQMPANSRVLLPMGRLLLNLTWTRARQRVTVPSCDGVALSDRLMKKNTAGSTYSMGAFCVFLNYDTLKRGTCVQWPGVC